MAIHLNIKTCLLKAFAIKWFTFSLIVHRIISSVSCNYFDLLSVSIGDQLVCTCSVYWMYPRFQFDSLPISKTLELGKYENFVRTNKWFKCSILPNANLTVSTAKVVFCCRKRSRAANIHDCPQPYRHSLLSWGPPYSGWAIGFMIMRWSKIKNKTNLNLLVKLGGFGKIFFYIKSPDELTTF